ncbi:uncharacterized protein LOC115456388 [Manduca sexta]|uniref:uncharacterized protein LOC115456388 n=1 Tax=Manduca sexta TaxID=7130 RepID=UPI00188E5F05|nr:uncharacterized protein LOC115456388 [Manduca sexta]
MCHGSTINQKPTPETKNIKLTFTNKCTTPTRAKPGGRMKQARLNLVKVKQTNIVDLTCSPEFAGGLRTVKTESDITQIKRELIDNDDTILPSPTSAPDNYTLFKSISKPSPVKFKKPLSLKNKTENSRLQFEDVENKPLNSVKNDPNEKEESINIMQHLHKRYTESPKKEANKEAQGHNDTTYCEPDNSISLLQNVNNLNALQDNHCSPQKRPLAENKNIVNTPPKVDVESTSLKTSGRDTVNRCIPELVEPLYKEQTVRKKAEKRALPGWCCDDCKRFYGALYSDDPVMMARKIEECSKHRGRHNPVRPKTPPNFWNPRWNVPDDTEELNRMNNAI